MEARVKSIKNLPFSVHVLLFFCLLCVCFSLRHVPRLVFFLGGESVTRSCGLRISEDFVLIESNPLGTGEFDQAEGASLRFTREAVRAMRSVSILCWLKLHSFSGAPHKWRDASEARGLTAEFAKEQGRCV